MKKTNVEVCDICEDKLAVTMCGICKKDICKSCFRYLDFSSGFNVLWINIKRGKLDEGRAPLCKKCINKFNSLFNLGTKEFRKLREKGKNDKILKIIHERKKLLGEQIIKTIRNFMISEAL